MAKKNQQKYYAEDELVEAAVAIFTSQGVNVSEGITRLLRLLVGSPKELWPVLLLQAQGEASAVLARHVAAMGVEPSAAPEALPQDIQPGDRGMKGKRKPKVLSPKQLSGASKE